MLRNLHSRVSTIGLRSLRMGSRLSMPTGRALQENALEEVEYDGR